MRLEQALDLSILRMWTFHENDFVLIKSCALSENEHRLKAKAEHESLKTEHRIQ